MPVHTFGMNGHISKKKHITHTFGAGKDDMASEKLSIQLKLMTEENISAFLDAEASSGSTENALRRYRRSVRCLFDYLPGDKQLSKESLVEWRREMEESGYSSATIENYVKGINRYLDFIGCEEMRFNKGHAKDIRGMTFGYLTAVCPTDKKSRGNVVWLCECKCGNTVELPATRLLLGNTLSCGCLKGEHFKKTNKSIARTNLRQALDDKAINPTSASGYVGVTPKRDKWQAYIRYRGVQYSLGCYSDIEDAVKARARAKEIVMEDARGLLAYYEELHRNDPPPPSQMELPHIERPMSQKQINSEPFSSVRRSDNTSGYVGINFRHNRWESRISYKGVRYMLGRFETLQEAVRSRQQAEQMLKTDPEKFIYTYSSRLPLTQSN